MAAKKPIKNEGGQLKEFGSTDTIPTNNLGTGTADNTTYLRGDNTWQAISAGGLTQAQVLIRETYGGF